MPGTSAAERLQPQAPLAPAFTSPPTTPPPTTPAFPSPPPPWRVLLLHRGAFLLTALAQMFIVVRHTQRLGVTSKVAAPVAIAVAHASATALTCVWPLFYWRHR